MRTHYRCLEASVEDDVTINDIIGVLLQRRMVEEPLQPAGEELGGGESVELGQLAADRSLDGCRS